MLQDMVGRATLGQDMVPDMNDQDFFDHEMLVFIERESRLVSQWTGETVGKLARTALHYKVLASPCDERPIGDPCNKPHCGCK